MPATSRSKSPRVLLTCAFALAVLSNGASARSQTLGWLEWAWLQPGHVRVKSKLDTGARTSSIDADQIETFIRDERRWVRFRVPLAARPDDSDHGRDLMLERPVVREILIKDHVLQPAARYVVEIDLCIAGKTFTTPVTLADRSRFNYPLLLGRSALAGRARVDAAKKYIAADGCAEPERD